MQDWIVVHEAGVRLAAFVGVLLLLLGAQEAWPRRARPARRGPRWAVNLSLVAIDTVFVRLVVPLGAAAAALWAARNTIGLFNQLPWPALLEAALSFLALDALIYWQHRLFHQLPPFWRLHRMHHSDLEFDTTTGVRFHPVEIAVSMLIKIAAVAALGAPAIAVIVFEVALNATSLFNHTNLRLPAAVDRRLRFVLVTPDMHRVHHSIVRAETDSNFGFNLSCWDRLLGSYRAQPRDGHTQMAIGLPQFRTEAEQALSSLLLQPLAASPET